MSNNNENLSKINNGNHYDQPASNDGFGGNVLAPRNNLPAINTDQPFKPATGSAVTSQADSGYRTGSTPGPGLVTPETISGSSSASPLSARGRPVRHGRHDAQDLGHPSADARLAPIDESRPVSSTPGHRHNGDPKC